ncbi:hypothetical protein ebA5941 [Aromatoleum aromaticum EbN1]|uniref:Glycosyl transferase family 1 domain-containing protein n=1 Tax=Aromatoleum aromaticum (strain DSM 19018 / LMG 30748 / EbN1) TaxID=76114 RepID=Q5NZK8_AROAE|nr:hypothetical protein ebA5941 [Aromatoleum aromaticum EbN1]
MLLPSYREGLPKGLIEAAACALPLITANAPGCTIPPNCANAWGLLRGRRRWRSLTSAS